MSSQFVETIEVSTAREIFAWAETHPTIDGDEWPVDAAAGREDDARFVVAVPVPAREGDEWARKSGMRGEWVSLVGFFAVTEADADRIRESVF